MPLTAPDIDTKIFPEIVEERIITCNSIDYEECWNNQNNWIYLRELQKTTEDSIKPEDDDLTEQNNQPLDLIDVDQKNMNTLELSYEKELLKYSDYITIDKKEAYSIFTTLLLNLSELPFENGIVEFSDINQLKITLSFDQNKLLMISKSLGEDEEIAEDEIIYSLFIDKELILSNVSKLPKFVEGFKKFLYM